MSGFSLQFEQFPLELDHVKSSGNGLLAHLELIFKYANYAVESRNWRGEALYLPQLDQAIIDLTKHSEIPRLNTTSTDNLSDCYVVLVTEVYVTGGHGRVMNRMVEELPSHIIFTDLFGRIASGSLSLNGLVSAQALSATIVSGDDILKKLRSILALLGAIRPKGVILLGHHQDVIVQIAGCTYLDGQRTTYFHHCDHEPALGALIRYPAHIDTIEEIKSICSEHGHSPRLWPMTVPPPSSVKSEFSNLGRIATCGSSIKFDGEFNGVYYKDIVRAVLLSSVSITLWHLGPLSESFLQDLVLNLRTHGVDPSRFVYVGPVSDLREFLIQNKVDLYIQSFPSGGGITAIEVQSIGIPAVYANPDVWSAKLIGSRSLYAEKSLEWSEVDKISEIILGTQTEERWRDHSEIAIHKYQKNFHPAQGFEFFDYLRFRSFQAA